MTRPFPIEDLEPQAGEAFATGITAGDAILYSLAVSARRIAAALERERLDEDEIIGRFIARAERTAGRRVQTAPGASSERPL